METVRRMKLGSQGFDVSAQDLGCMGMSAFYGPPKSDHEMVALIHFAITNGITLLDTSDVYGPHMAHALKGGMREKAELATKFGIIFDQGEAIYKGDPAYVRAACEASLKRLDISQGSRLRIWITTNACFERVSEIASSKGCTPAQLALAWVHHQGDDVCPIPGTTKIENLKQNIGALSVKLTPEEISELEALASADAVKGDRYVISSMTTFKDSETPPLSSWKPE